MMVTNRKIFSFLFLVLALAAADALLGGACAAKAFAVEPFAAQGEHATLIREESMYGSAGANAQKTGQVERGSALTILERSTADGQPWVKISMAAEDRKSVV